MYLMKQAMPYKNLFIALLHLYSTFPPEVAVSAANNNEIQFKNILIKI